MQVSGTVDALLDDDVIIEESLRLPFSGKVTTQ
jgi:hypothetical protein